VSTQNPGAVDVTITTGFAQAAAFAVWPQLPQVSVACGPASLTDSAAQVSTCTVTVNNPPLDDFSIPLTVSTNPRYTSTCGALS
jgi:hypothetical protein